MDIKVQKSGVHGGGRGLFAQKDFQPGDLVFSTTRPYVAELDTLRLRDTCSWCFVRQPGGEESNPVSLQSSNNGVELKPCSACRRVRYCSTTCQSKAWKREHKYECKILAQENRPDFPHGVRAVIKLLGRLKADPEGKDEKLLDILQFQPFVDPDLLRTIKETKPQRFEEFEMLSYAAYKYAGELKIGDMDSIVIARGFFFNVINNTITLSAPHDDISLGIGFDPIVCSANHSCDPNTIVVFNQPGLIIRALRPIAKGEEIFIKYVDVTNPQSVRQADLKDSYYFDCTCSKCQRTTPGIEDKFQKPIEQLNPVIAKVADNLIQRHQQQLSRFAVGTMGDNAERRLAAMQAEAFSVSGTTFDFNKANSEASEDEVRDALKLCLNSGMWDWHRQPVPHLLRQLLTIKLAAGQTYQAWRLAAKMHIVVSPALHPTAFYPDRLVDMWTLATLTNQLTSPEHRELYVEILRGGLDLQMVFAGLLFEVRKQIPLCYGQKSPFGRLVEGIYQHCVTNINASVAELEDMIAQTWPKVETVARSVDVLAI